MTTSDQPDDRSTRPDLLFTGRAAPPPPSRAALEADQRPRFGPTRRPEPDPEPESPPESATTTPVEPPAFDPSPPPVDRRGPKDDDAASPAIGIERRVSRVERRLGEVAHALERLVPAVDTVRSLVVDELATLQGDVRRTGAVVDSFSAALDAETASLAQRLDDVDQRFRSGDADRSVRLHLEELADVVRTGAARSSLLADEQRQALVDEVGALLRDHLARLTEEPAAPEGPDVSSVVDEAVARMQATLEASLVAQAGRVETAVSAMRRAVEAALESSSEVGTARVEGAVERVDGTAYRLDRTVAEVRAELLTELARTRDLTADRSDRFESQIAGVLSGMVADRADATSQLDDLLDLVRASAAGTHAPVEALASAVESLHADVRDGRDESLEDRRTVQTLTDRVLALEAVIDDLQSGLREDFAAQLEQLEEQSRGHLEAMVAEGSATQASLSRAASATTVELQEAAGRTSDELRRLVGSLREDVEQDLLAQRSAAQEQLGRAVSAVESLEVTLVDHFAARDRHAVLERAELTRSFAEQLADNLSRRDRRRLARRLEVPEVPDPDEAVVTERLREVLATVPGEQRPEPPRAAPASPPDEPTPAAPAEDEPALLEHVEDLFEDDEPPRWDDDDVDGGGESGDEDAPSPPVRPSRRTRPVRSRASDARDPAAMRRALQAVPGLGPAKQSALIDAFGTLEGIRAASDDDLLAIKGVGPSLLEAIRRSL